MHSEKLSGRLINYGKLFSYDSNYSSEFKSGLQGGVNRIKGLCGASNASHSKSVSLQTSTRSLKGLNSGCIPSKRLAGVLSRSIAVHLHQLHDVELGLLQHLYLADHAVLQGEDAACRLRDGAADRIGDPDKE